jgi:hypothetical protein
LRDVGDQDGPVGEGQLHSARRLPLATGFLPELSATGSIELKPTVYGISAKV